MKKAIIITLLLTLTGCKTVHDVEYIHSTDSVYVTDRQVDTLIVNRFDSVYVNTYTKGDTVYVTKFKYNDRVVYKTREKIDTLINLKVDTVYVTKTIEPKRSKSVTGWLIFSVCIFCTVLGYLCNKSISKC